MPFTMSALLALAARPAIRWAAAALAILAFLAWVDHRAFRSGEAAAEARHAAEAARQIAATAPAVEGAATDVATIDALRREIETRQRRIDDAGSPDASPCIPGDVLRQLDAVGR